MVGRGFGLALAGLLTAALPVTGQGRSAIVGVVVAAEGGPIAGARVTITFPSGHDTVLVADGRGRFALRHIAPGRYWVIARWDGSVSPRFPVNLADRERFEAEFTVRAEAPVMGPTEGATLLPEVETTGKMNEGVRSVFEERMATGLGVYLTEEEIARRESAGLNDLLRNVNGVRINCTGRDGCYPVTLRAPPGCMPSYYIDDMLTDHRHVAMLRSTELRGVEIYQGLSQIPPELVRDRARARCGVIAVWTRRGYLPDPRTPDPRDPVPPVRDTVPPAVPPR